MKKEEKKVPYIYRKLGEMLGTGNSGFMKLPELQTRLTNFRIQKREALEIARELEKQGIIVLDVKRGVNQHLKIKVVSKGVAKFYMASFIILLYCAVLSVSAFVVGVLF